MVRQYIGARYVPKFYDFNGSTNWRSGTEYEPLTIVTRNGNSYTSKKPVPSNIGEPENNPEYWVATGLYNEQVEAYRQIVMAVSARLDDFMGDGAIGTDNLADDAVTGDKIADGAVGTNQLANNGVTGNKIGSGAIGTNQLANGGVTSEKIYNGAVGTNQLANGGVTSEKIYNGAVGTNQLANNGVTEGKIADGAITTEKIPDHAITVDKLAPKYIINVGDSYQGGYDPEGNNQGWGSYLLSMFGYQGHNIKGVGGAGFGAGVGSQFDLAGILEANPPTDIDYDKVTDIVVGSGYNDFKRITSEIDAGIMRFYNHCKDRYPNAKIWLAPVGWAWTNNSDGVVPSDVGKTFNQYMNTCKNIDVNIVYSCLGILFGCNGVTTDYKHPTEAGNKAIASAIHAAFGGQEYMAIGGSYSLPVTGTGWSGTISAAVSTIGGTAQIRLGFNGLQYSGESVSLTDLTLAFAHHPFMCRFSAIIGNMIQYGSKYANVPLSFAVNSNGSCALGVQLINESRSNYESATSIRPSGASAFQPAFAVQCANG